MTPNPLLSCRIKIDRASKHLEELKANIDAFQCREPYQVVADEETEPAVRVHRLHIVEEIPHRWSGIIGDVIHNLRSALDSLATALVARAGHTSNAALNDTYFPIRSDAAGLSDENAKAFFKRAGPDVEKLVRRLQPYRGGRGDALWRLNRLDIIDKHRVIIPVGSTLAGVQFFGGTVEEALPDRPGAIRPRYPLKEGDELSRTAFFEAHYTAHANFTFEVAFGEGQIVDGQPLLPTLRQFVDLTERIIDIFARKVVKAGW